MQVNATIFSHLVLLQIKPLVRPTKDIMGLNKKYAITNIQYAWHEFFPNGNALHPSNNLHRLARFKLFKLLIFWSMQLHTTWVRLSHSGPL